MVDQIIAGGVSEPTSQAIPVRAEKAVNIKPSNRRTIKIRLLPKVCVERKLSYELMSAIGLEAQEYGIKAYEAIEYNTSRLCAYHGVKATHSIKGVINCTLGHKIHSDLKRGSKHIEKSNRNADPGRCKAALISCVSKRSSTR